jgi:hypothetical protein
MSAARRLDQPAPAPGRNGAAAAQAAPPERPRYPPRPDEAAQRALPGPRRLYRRGRRRERERARAAPPPAALEPLVRAQESDDARDADAGPSMLSMMRIVAVSVVLIVLVFFGAGYGFARLFM